MRSASFSPSSSIPFTVRRRSSFVNSSVTPPIFACGTSNGYDASGSDFLSGILEDMLAGSDQRAMPHESQRSLHAVLKPEMAKLCQVLHLSGCDICVEDLVTGIV